MNNQGDGAGILVAFVCGLVLLLFTMLLGMLVLNLVGLFLIGWYVTHLLVATLDRASDGQLLEEHSGLMLVGSALWWAFIAWMVVPRQLPAAVASLWPHMTENGYMIPLVGAAFGLGWGVLVLFTSGEDDDTTLDISGMYSLTAQDLEEGESHTVDALADSVILGADVE